MTIKAYACQNTWNFPPKIYSFIHSLCHLHSPVFSTILHYFFVCVSFFAVLFFFFCFMCFCVWVLLLEFSAAWVRWVQLVCFRWRGKSAIGILSIFCGLFETYLGPLEWNDCAKCFYCQIMIVKVKWLGVAQWPETQALDHKNSLRCSIFRIEPFTIAQMPQDTAINLLYCSKLAMTISLNGNCLAFLL